MIGAESLVFPLPQQTAASIALEQARGSYVPRGFLGTRADLLFDTIAVSLVLIAPILAWSQSLARSGAHRRHRAIMVTLFATLTLAIALFEVDLRMAGGARVLFKGSRFAGTSFMTGSLYSHVAVAITTFAAWLGLIVVSLRAFTRSLPGKLSSFHRIWGWGVIYGFLLVTATALEVYVVGFVF
jgi:hypothetical protein